MYELLGFIEQDDLLTGKYTFILSFFIGIVKKIKQMKYRGPRDTVVCCALLQMLYRNAYVGGRSCRNKLIRTPPKDPVHL